MAMSGLKVVVLKMEYFHILLPTQDEPSFLSLPTAALCLGPYGGPGGGRFFMITAESWVGQRIQILAIKMAKGKSRGERCLNRIPTA